MEYVWTKTIERNGECYSVQQSNDGGYIIVGSKYSSLGVIMMFTSSNSHPSKWE